MENFMKKLDIEKCANIETLRSELARLYTAYDNEPSVMGKRDYKTFILYCESRINELKRREKYMTG